MHFNFDFSAEQVLWTLTFAALLVLLVVLLGRDRARRFPWFTASMSMMALLLLTEQLLLGRLPRITGAEIYWVLSILDVAISLLVLVELARRSFRGMGKLGWIIGAVVMLAIGVTVMVMWGPWPAWKTLTGTSELALLRMIQLAVDKGSLLSSVLTIELGLLITLLGRRFGAGWHSHAQRIAIGLSTVSLGQLTLLGTLRAIGTHTHFHSRAEYDHVMDMRENLIHGNNLLFLCVIAWWIGCLWIDEPGTVSAAEAEPEPAEGEAIAAEAHEPADESESHPESAGTDAHN